MTKNLDLYDYKILHELDKDARKPASEIAGHVRLSKVSVNQRIKKLQDKGIIKDFAAQVNYRKLGYTTCHVFYKLQNISSENEEKLYSYLKNHKLIGSVARIDGNFDIFLIFAYKTNEDLDEVLTEINNKFGNYIKERTILLIFSVQYFGRRYLLDEKEKAISPIIRRKSENLTEIDEIDHNILKILCQNARIPIIELAKKLNISKDIAHYRIKKLIKDGILQKFTINLNHEKFENSFFKLLVNFNYNTDEKEFLSRISLHKNLIRTIRSLGSWDLELDFEISNNKELRKILKEIKEKLGDYIKTIDSLFIYQIDKLNYYPF